MNKSFTTIKNDSKIKYNTFFELLEVVGVTNL